MDKIDSYKTLLQPSEGIFRDRGSRFLSFAYPIDSENEVKPILIELRRKFHGARHHCHAFRMGPTNEIYRVNDDGEPSGTAGMPIYRQITAHGLFDVLVAVVRYFGGTLLGKSGLIHAYKIAAKEALDAAKLKDKIITNTIKLSFNASDIGEVMRILSTNSCSILSQEYEEKCNFLIQVRLCFTQSLQQKLKSIKGLDWEEIS